MEVRALSPAFRRTPGPSKDRAFSMNSSKARARSGADGGGPDQPALRASRPSIESFETGTDTFDLVEKFKGPAGASRDEVKALEKRLVEALSSVEGRLADPGFLVESKSGFSQRFRISNLFTSYDNFEH